jgi:DNA-binding PadR family transcriptional regulator
MKLLTRAEEYVLLTVISLGDKAYSLPILDHIEKTTRRKWTLGGIYIPLYRLEEKGYLTSELGPPTKERGGKRKRYYRITRKGKEALKEHKKIQTAMWSEVAEAGLD